MSSLSNAAKAEADKWIAERKKNFPTLHPASFDQEGVFIVMGFLAGVAWKEQVIDSQFWPDTTTVSEGKVKK